MIPEWVQLVSMIATPVFAAGAVFAATRTTQTWHDREIKRAHKRLDTHDRQFIELFRGNPR